MTERAPPASKESQVLQVLALLGVGLLGLLTLVLGGALWLGSEAPDTAVVAGNQMNRAAKAAAIELGALIEGETVAYYYGWGLEYGDEFLIVTPDHVAIVDAQAADPVVTVGYADIEHHSLVRDTSLWNDSLLELYLHDQRTVGLPLSSEEGGDLRVHEYIRSRLDALTE